MTQWSTFAFAKFEIASDIQQGDFNQVVTDVGALSSFKFVQSPKNIGNLLSALGVEYAQTKFNPNAKHWESAYESDSPDVLNSVKLKYQRGLSGHADLTAVVGNAKNLYFFSVDHKDVFIRDRDDGLFGALRPNLTFATVPGDLIVFTPAVDVSFGYEFSKLTPYISFGFGFPMGAAPHKKGLIKTREFIQKAAAGLGLETNALQLFCEYETSEHNTLSVSLRKIF